MFFTRNEYKDLVVESLEFCQQKKGMEIYAYYFVQHFSKTVDLTIVSKKNGSDVVVNSDYEIIENINLLDYLKSFENERCIVYITVAFGLKSRSTNSSLFW